MASPVDPASPGSLPPGADPHAANADSVTPIAPPASSVPTTKSVLMAGWVTGVTAGIVCLALRILAGLFGTGFHVNGPGTDPFTVTWLAAFIVPLVAGIVGSLIAAIFLGVRGCRRWVFWLGTGVLVLSLVPPWLWASDVTWPTRIWLAVMQVLTWFLIVPQIARVVGDSDPKVTAGYRE